MVMDMRNNDLLFGLVGFPLGHSFSKQYYDTKIAREGIDGVRYELFEMQDIQSFPALVANTPGLSGVNITIPHKISVIDYLDELSEEARAIGAVNCVRILRTSNAGELGGKTQRLIGYNTDAYGFERSLLPLLDPHLRSGAAMVLGSGGAAKAVCYVLEKLQIRYTIVSRSGRHVGYEALDQKMIEEHPLIINTTPVGMYPKVDVCPELPYDFLGPQHLLYDLVYNPMKTVFLARGEARGARIKNGLDMLEAQAARNWEIWTQ